MRSVYLPIFCWLLLVLPLAMAVIQSPPIVLSCDSDRMDAPQCDSSSRMLLYATKEPTVLIREGGPSGYVVWEYGKNGGVSRKIDDLIAGWDVEAVDESRILVAESRWISERNWQGKILWEKELSDIVVRCQRLPNGNTFVATHSSFLEFSSEGKRLYQVETKSYIEDAQRMRNGYIAYLGQGMREITLVKASGQRVGRVPLGEVGFGESFSALPDNRFLIVAELQNKVVEINEKGKVLWSCEATLPTTAARLPNGNTLVGSRNMQYIMEVDRFGKVLWKKQTQGQVMRIRVKD